MTIRAIVLSQTTCFWLLDGQSRSLLGAAQGGRQRRRCTALLHGLLYCQSCGRVMAHTYSRRREKQYRYYTCSNVIKRGRASCPTPSLPAPKIEQAILAELRGMVAARLTRALRQVQALQTNDSTNQHQTEPSIERENRMHAAFTAAQFDSAWGTLDPQDQARVLQALVQRIEFDAHGGMRMRLRPEEIDDQHSVEEAA